MENEFNNIYDVFVNMFGGEVKDYQISDDNWVEQAIDCYNDE